MSCVLDFYADRMETLFVENKEPVKALVTRQGRSINPQSINNNKKLLLYASADIECGDLVSRRDNTRYFVVSQQYSPDTIECQTKKVNQEISVYKVVPVFENYEMVGNKRELVQYGVPASEMDISTKMKSYDAGLLQQTIKTIIIKQDIEVEVGSIVTIGSTDYMVVNVDDHKIKNLLHIQLGEETRQVLDSES